MARLLRVRRLRQKKTLFLIALKRTGRQIRRKTHPYNAMFGSLFSTLHYTLLSPLLWRWLRLLRHEQNSRG